LNIMMMPSTARRRLRFAGPLALGVFVAIGSARSVPAQKLQKEAKSPGAAPRVSIDRRATVAADASIRLSGAITSLRIVGWDRDSLVLTGTMPEGWRFDGGVVKTPAGVGRAAKYFIDTPSDLYPTGAAVELKVPAGARVWAKSGSADIEVSGVTGGLDLNIVGGSVTVSSSPRELNVESMDGNVRVLGGASWLRVKTATGDVEVRGGSEDAGVSTVSGTVRVSDGRYERGKLETVTGDIIYEGEIGYKGSVDLTTHSGRVELRLPPKPNLELDAATVTGTIENGVTSSRPIAGREGRGMELGFSSGTGDTRVVVRSFKGNVVLKPR
jgi:Putative adhesin